MISNHELCIIPGPMKFDETVLEAMIVPATAHNNPEFIGIFGETIGMVRKLLMSKTAQPFIVSGSSTLGWDMVCNLVEENDQVLVLSHGFFGSQISECLEVYGTKVTTICAEIGSHISQEVIKKTVSKTRFKLVMVTHVETSTGVLSDIQTIAETVNSVSPDTLILVDSVCSIASEEICFDLWGLDMVITSSQKGLGVPSGLSIVVVSQKAIKVSQNRKSPIASYYANWNKWLPVMQAYEAGQSLYFATPPVQLICALYTSLTKILSQPLKLRFHKQRQIASEFRQIIKNWGLELVPHNEAYAANGVTYIWLPKGFDVMKLVKIVGEKGAQINVGLLKTSTPYFGVGHNMGFLAMEGEFQHMKMAKHALFYSLKKIGYSFKGSSVASDSRL